MEFLQYVERSLPITLPILVGAACCALIAVLIRWFVVDRKQKVDSAQNVRRQIVRILLTLIVLASAVTGLSLIEQTRASATVLVGLLGVAISAAITISSATFISNAMAGLMLRAVRNFRLGDYVRVGDRFGRVSERGLFHVELQTEDRDLATLPNLYLVSQPVTVVRASGTIVSTTVSLGYDVPHTRVEEALERAALAAELKEPFVYILELGDFSITYRIAAFLPKVKHLLSARSRLCTCVLDALHEDGIEIVSPVFMNQRQLSEKTVVLSQPAAANKDGTERAVATPEDLMFDKAELAEQHAMSEQLKLEIAELETRLGASDEAARPGIEAALQQLRGQVERIEIRLAAAPEDEES